MLNGTRNVRDHHDWWTEWVVARRSFDASIPPCSAIARRRLIDAPDGQVRQHPEHRVHPPHPAHDRGAEQHRLDQQDLPERVAHPGVGGAEPGELLAEELEPGLAGRVAHQLAPEAGRADRVSRVQRDVGLVGPELLTVVGHVHAAVRVGRRERGVTEQPPADEIVGASVGEQQPVRRFVHERQELRVRAAHEQEREHVPDRVPPPHREADDRRRPAPTPRPPTARCATTGWSAAGHGTRAAGARRAAPAPSPATG